MSARARNRARAKDVVPVMMFVTDHEEFLVRLVALTPRPSTNVIAQAVTTTFCDIAPAKAFQFAMMVARSVSSVRSMRRSVTTGKKLPKAVVRLARLLNGQCKTPSIGKEAKSLKRHISDASSGAELQESVCTSAPLVEVSSGDASDDEHCAWVRNHRSILSAYGVALTSASPSATSLTARSSKVDSALVPTAIHETRLEAFLTPEGLTRIHADGRCELAIMTPGPRRFAMARREDSSELIETEKPNVALPANNGTDAGDEVLIGKPTSTGGPTFKRPACKKTAAAGRSKYVYNCNNKDNSIGLRRNTKG